MLLPSMGSEPVLCINNFKDLTERERGAAMEGPDFSSVHERDHPTFAEQLFGGIFEGFEVLT